MSETTVISTVNQRTQIGVETTPGTAVAALKELLATSFQIGAKAETLKFRPQGRKFNTVLVPNKEWSEAKLSGVADYNELAYVLSMILGGTTPAQQGGTTAYKWTWAPSASAADTRKAVTLQQGSVERAQRVAGLTMRDFGIKFSRDGIEITGAAFGKALEDSIQMSTNEVQTITVTGGPTTSGNFTLTYGGQTTGNIAWNASAATVQAALEALSNIAVGDVNCTGGPFPGTGIAIEFRGTLRQTDVAALTAADTFDAGDVVITETIKGAAPTSTSIIPMLPETIDVYVADAQGDLDAADALTGLLSIELSIGNRYVPHYLLASAYGRGYGKVSEGIPEVMINIEPEADEEGMAWLTQMRAGDKKYLRIKSTGELIEGAYYYDFQLDLCVGVSEPSDFGDNNGLRTSPFALTAMSDADWSNKALQLDLINILTGL